MRNVLCLLLIALSLSGCLALKRQFFAGYLQRQSYESGIARAHYFADPKNDFISDLDSHGVKSVDFLRRDVEGILFNIVISGESEDKTFLVDLFLRVHEITWDSPKDEFLAFINAPELMAFILAKLDDIDVYSVYSPEQMQLVQNSLYQYYNNKVINESTDSEIQRKLDLVTSFLEI